MSVEPDVKGRRPSGSASLRQRCRAVTGDALRAARGAAAVLRRRALLAFLGAPRGRHAGDDLPAVRAGGLTAEAAAALVARQAASAVGLAGIERPEAAHVARRELLPLEVE